MRRFLSLTPAIFLGLWLFFQIGGRSQLFRDPGVFWHTVVGERILETGRQVRVDPFSFTHAGEPWISSHWLVECTLALTHRVSALDGILLLTATVLAALFTWVAHRLLAAGLHPLTAILLTALVMAASAQNFHPRPHVVTLIGLGWTFAMLCDREAGRISTARMFGLVPVFVVWSNAHGGVPGGLATLALVVLGWWIQAVVFHDGPAAERRSALLLGLLVPACALTVLINPFGLEMPRTWFALLGSPVLPRVIDEHRPLLSKATGWGAVPLMVVYVAALLGTWPSRPRVTCLIPLAWMVLGLGRARHASLFAITAAIALAEMLPHVRWMSWMAERGSDFCRIRPPTITGPSGRTWTGWIVPLAVVLTAVTIQSLGVAMPVIGRGWARLDPTYWPVDLLPELRAYEQSHPDGTPLFNDMLFGGFLIGFTPGLRVFIDDRCELYGDAGLMEYMAGRQDDPGRIEAWADRHGFDRALTEAGSGFDRYLRSAPRWRVVRTSPAGSFYARMDGDTVSSWVDTPPGS